MTNADLADRFGHTTQMNFDELLRLRTQQEALVARIAFIASTESDIRREVEAFIESARM